MPLAIVHWPLQRQPQGGPVKGPLGSREAAAHAQQNKKICHVLFLKLFAWKANFVWETKRIKLFKWIFVKKETVHFHGFISDA